MNSALEGEKQPGISKLIRWERGYPTTPINGIQFTLRYWYEREFWNASPENQAITLTKKDVTMFSQLRRIITVRGSAGQL